jgi:ABC-type nitrate/sulfonate/bicarbonate transport system substrate-binding protein
VAGLAGLYVLVGRTSAAEQPIAFSHYNHNIMRQINCLYCHQNATQGYIAQIPPVETCYGCHRFVGTQGVASSNFVQTDLVVRPEIKTAADLKGKRIGVTSIGGTGWMSAMLALEQIGINPERDKVSLAAFGDQRVITQALETNTIQGASLAGIFSRRLQRNGYNFLAEVEKIPLVGTSIVLKADYLASHQALVRSALRALIEGHGFVLNPANKQAVMDVMTKKLAINDPVAANDGYEDYVRRTDKRAFVVLDGLKNIQRFMKVRNPKIGDIALDHLVDDSIMREFEKSGFLDQALSGKVGIR